MISLKAQRFDWPYWTALKIDSAGNAYGEMNLGIFKECSSEEEVYKYLQEQINEEALTHEDLEEDVIIVNYTDHVHDFILDVQNHWGGNDSTIYRNMYKIGNAIIVLF